MRHPRSATGIRWARPTQSGLGDRLSDILFMATYARVHSAPLYVRWPAFEPKAIDVGHRMTDILLDNVVRYIYVPRDIVFDARTVCRRTFENGIGGAGDPLGFYVGYLKDMCSKEHFCQTFEQVARDFRFCSEINDYLATLPDKFCSFHIRRGDKVRDNEHDNFHVLRSELDWLNDLTFQSIDRLREAGYTNFFLCGDEDEKTQPFVDYLRAKSCYVMKTPELEKWQTTYFDLATMTKSDYNITSQRYSSFSRFPTFIGKGRFASVIGLMRDGLPQHGLLPQ